MDYQMKFDFQFFEGETLSFYHDVIEIKQLENNRNNKTVYLIIYNDMCQKTCMRTYCVC